MKKEFRDRQDWIHSFWDEPRKWRYELKEEYAPMMKRLLDENGKPTKWY